jgi:hypothetical protein
LGYIALFDSFRFREDYFAAAFSPRFFDDTVRGFRFFAGLASAAAAFFAGRFAAAFFAEAFFAAVFAVFLAFAASETAFFALHSEDDIPCPFRMVATVADGLAPTDNQYFARARSMRTGSFSDRGS